jgi:hypothetical protein
MVLFQAESPFLGLVFGFLEIVLSDTQQSRGAIEDIERAKEDSFDTRISIGNSGLVVLGYRHAGQLNPTLIRGLPLLSQLPIGSIGMAK